MTVYVLLEKFLETEFTQVEGVYSTLEEAEQVMEDLMEDHTEERGYKIEVKRICQ